MATIVVGQAVRLALGLAWPRSDAASESLALGGLLRVTAELLYLFLPLAVLMLSHRSTQTPGAG